MRLLAAPMNGATIWAFATLPMTLPEGRYAFDFDGKLPASRTVQDWMLGWALASYRFTRYRAPKRGPATILWPEAVERGDVDPLTRAVERGDVDPLTRAVERTRDLINMPADDMGPQELEDAVHGIAAETGASVRSFAGAGLLENDFPAIHMVGRASNRAPRLIDLTWRMATDPRVTLVGKGVCFDTGGLDIKAHDPMLEMKKDMGGAAIMLGLAGALMAANLPIWRDYRPQISGTISDLANVAKGNFGGAIIAAMFLAEFVSRARLWMHVDIYAANASSRPGRPEGGEATGLRALYAFIRERYGARPPKAAR